MKSQETMIIVAELHKPSEYETPDFKLMETVERKLVVMAKGRGDRFDPFSEADYVQVCGNDLNPLNQMVGSNLLTLVDGLYHFKALFLGKIEKYRDTPLRTAILAEEGEINEAKKLATNEARTELSNAIREATDFPSLFAIRVTSAGSGIGKLHWYDYRGSSVERTTEKVSGKQLVAFWLDYFGGSAKVYQAFLGEGESMHHLFAVIQQAALKRL